MHRYALGHLSDDALLHGLATLVARDRATTAELLAHVAEVDARKLYVPAGYPSMYLYCLQELRLSEDAAFKRIQAARAARRFPAIFEAIASGRLHLSGVCLLAPHLTEETAGKLLQAATHKTKAEIERLLAERFPRPDLMSCVTAVPQAAGAGPDDRLAPGQVNRDQIPAPDRSGEPPRLAPGQVDCTSVAGPAGGTARLKPLAPQRFAVQFTMGQSAHDKLRYAQELLGLQIPAGDIAAIFERALDALIPQLEKQKFAATEHPRRGSYRASESPRHIPARIKRAVWERDQGRCTFVSESGRRCEARRGLQFDHVREVARGGEASLPDIRLLCRVHNQYAAERTFGAEFMRHKRIAAAERRTAAARTVRDGPGAMS